MIHIHLSPPSLSLSTYNATAMTEILLIKQKINVLKFVETLNRY